MILEHRKFFQIINDPGPGQEQLVLDHKSRPGGGGGSHIDMEYVYVPAFWGTFSRNLV